MDFTNELTETLFQVFNSFVEVNSPVVYCTSVFTLTCLKWNLRWIVVYYHGADGKRNGVGLILKETYAKNL